MVCEDEKNVCPPLFHLSPGNPQCRYAWFVRPENISNLTGEADASQKSEVRSQKSEGRGLDCYLAALPAMKYKCGSHLIPLANSTNAVALNAAPNAATRSGNLFLGQRTRFPALLEMILRGIGKTHF